MNRWVETEPGRVPARVPALPVRGARRVAAVLLGCGLAPGILGSAPPSAVVLNGSTVREHQPAGAAVGILVAVDGDAADTHTFSLVPGEGGEDNAHFAVDGDVLRTAATFDHADRNGFRVRVRARDGEGGEVEAPFTVRVTHPEFAAAADAYFRANPAVAAASVERLGSAARDYFWVFLHQLAETGRAALDAPANLPPDHEVAGPSIVTLTASEVERIHAAKVAHAIWVDLNRFVPWRLADYDPGHLDGLFDPAVLFDFGRFNYIVDHSPSEAWHYAIAHDLRRADIQATVEAVIDDMRSDFIHGSSSFDPRTALSLRAALGDYRVRSTLPHRVTRIGCHSSTRIFLGLLRALNIPGYQTTAGEYFLSGHSTAVLPCIGRTLAHGDDIYSATNRAVPASLLLVPFAFFEDNATAPPALGDVGGLAVRYHALLATQFPTNSTLSDVRNPPSRYGGSAAGFLVGYAGWDRGLTEAEIDAAVETLLTNYDETRTLTVGNSGGAGDVLLSPSGSAFPVGSQVSLKAVPTATHRFSHWGGDVPGDRASANPVILTMDTDRSISPLFVAHEDPGEGLAPSSIEARTVTVIRPDFAVRATFGPGGTGARQASGGRARSEMTTYVYKPSGDQALLQVTRAAGLRETITLEFRSPAGGAFSYRDNGEGSPARPVTGTFSTDGQDFVLTTGTASLLPLPKLRLELPRLAVRARDLAYGRSYTIERSFDLSAWEAVHRFSADRASADWSEPFGAGTVYYRLRAGP